jgi:hypothetical protein
MHETGLLCAGEGSVTGSRLLQGRSAGFQRVDGADASRTRPLCVQEDEYLPDPPAAAAPLITSARFWGAGGLGIAPAFPPADMISLVCFRPA